MKKIISVIIPTYNEEKNIEYAYDRVVKVLSKLSKYSYEIVFVDNRSTDASQAILKKLARLDKKVTVIYMSRNFTSEYSSLAAMRHAIGDAITVVDCDLQDPPEIIPQFIKEWEKGNEVVIGVRDKITDPAIMKYLRKFFYLIFRKLANIDMPLNAGSFCLLDKKAMDSINNLPEKNRFFRGLRAWVGFSVSIVYYERRGRKYGKSKNSIFDYIHDAQRGILGFSFVPLDIMTTMGFGLVIVSFVFIITYLLIVFLNGNPINASIPIILSIFFFGGIQILAISIVGKYIQIIFEEVKNRPPYIIDKILNDHTQRSFKKHFK